MEQEIIGRVIKIHSIDRLNSNEPPHTCFFDLNNPQVTDIHANIYIKWFMLPFTLYNVNQFTRKITWYEKSTADPEPVFLSAEIPIRDYNGFELKDELQSLMNNKSTADGLGITYTITYSTRDGLFKFFCDDEIAGAQFWFDFLLTKNNAPCTRLLGFNNNSITEHGSFGNPVISDKMANLSSTLSIDIRLGGFFNGMESSKINKSTNILLSIPCRQSYGSMLIYEPLNNFEAFHVVQFFGIQKIFLTTNFENGLDNDKPLPIHSDWQMMIVVRRVKQLIQMKEKEEKKEIEE